MITMMMKSIRNSCTILVCVMASFCLGQDGNKKPEDQGPVILEDREIRKIADLLVEWEKERPSSSTDLEGIENQKAMAKIHDQLESLKESIGNPLKAVKSWWRVFNSDEYNQYSGKIGYKRNQKYDYDRGLGYKFEVVYQLQVPFTYRKETPFPLVLCLHPEGDKVDGAEYIRRFWSTREVRSAAIVLAPEMVQHEQLKGASWSHRKKMFVTLGTLGSRVFPEYNVDRNRLFLDGYGNSAREAWRLASSMADTFTGVIIRGGSPPEDLRLSDLGHTAFLLVGVPGMDLDPEKAEALAKKMRAAGVPVTVASLDEEPGYGRERQAFRQVAGDVMKFLEIRRDPYPDEIQLTVRDLYSRRCHWVRSTGELETELLGSENGNPVYPSYRVSVNREKNRLLIRSRGITGFRIELNDLLLDLDRPVSIMVNGKELYHGIQKRSFENVLESVLSSGDWTRIYPWRMFVKVPVSTSGESKSPEKQPGQGPVSKQKPGKSRNSAVKTDV